MKIRQFVIALCLSMITIVVVSCKNADCNLQATGSSTALVANREYPKLKYTSGIRAILEDGSGNIWFGSHQEGACLLRNGKYEYFTTENGLSDNQVRNIYEDKNGQIWFECGIGLSVYNGEEMMVWREFDYTAKDTWSVHDSDIWFKTNAQEGFSETEGASGVYQYDGKKLLFRAFPQLSSVSYGSEFATSVSTPFVKGKRNTVWFGTYSAVIGYNDSGFTIIDGNLLGLDKETGSLHVRSIFEDSKGNLWIGNNGIGVIKYNNRAENFTQQHKLTVANTNGNSLEHVFAIAEDNLGNMWFGTNKSGVWRYDGSSTKNFTVADGISSEHIWAIYKSKSGEMWFLGAEPSGVYAFNGKSFERKF